MVFFNRIIELGIHLRLKIEKKTNNKKPNNLSIKPMQMKRKQNHSDLCLGVFGVLKDQF